MDEAVGHGLRVLIVDDDEPVRGLLRTVLELAGWEVLEAEHGRQALALAKAERPHGIILDVLMPDMDGFDVLAGLRQSEHGRAMAIIMLSSKSRPSDILRGTRLGADHYATKPFDPQHVSERLAFHALRRSPGARAAASAPILPARRSATPRTRPA